MAYLVGVVLHCCSVVVLEVKGCEGRLGRQLWTGALGRVLVRGCGLPCFVPHYGLFPGWLLVRWQFSVVKGIVFVLLFHIFRSSPGI